MDGEGQRQADPWACWEASLAEAQLGLTQYSFCLKNKIGSSWGMTPRVELGLIHIGHACKEMKAEGRELVVI